MSPDMIVMRHSSAGAPHLLARMCRSVIINAGDGMHEHPTQALLDAFTIREHKKRIEGLKVAIVGDLLHSRVLRSNIQLLNKLGAHVWACGPSTLMPAGAGALRRAADDVARRGRRRCGRRDDAPDSARADAGALHPVHAGILLAVRAHRRTADARGSRT